MKLDRQIFVYLISNSLINYSMLSNLLSTSEYRVKVVPEENYCMIEKKSFGVFWVKHSSQRFFLQSEEDLKLLDCEISNIKESCPNDFKLNMETLNNYLINDKI